MKDFPSCFGENGVQIADSSSSSSSSSSTIGSKASQNLVSCIYQCKLLNRLFFIVVTWTKHLMGQCLTLQFHNSANQSLCKFDIKPWMFSKKKGCKNLDIHSAKIQIFWDLTNAKFGAGPEPEEGFYVAGICGRKLVFLIGDSEETRKNMDSDSESAVFVARREHIFGKKLYFAKTQFCDKGQIHNVLIECDVVGMNDPILVIKIDGKMAVKIKRLKWKFRGNQTIVVDGNPVEVFWDVHSWLFGSGISSSAVFMFQTHLPTEKGRIESSGLSCSYSQQSKDSKLQALDFSLILYAWRE